MGKQVRRKLKVNLPIVRPDIETDISAFVREYSAFVERGRGRPIVYHPSICSMVRKLALLNISDKEIAQVLGIDDGTFSRWKNEHPELKEMLMDGRLGADTEVVEKLRQRAVGYSYRTHKVLSVPGVGVIKTPVIEHLPPDPGSIKIWLSNRRPDKWREPPNPDKNDPGRHPEFTGLMAGSLRESIEDKLRKLKGRITVERTTVTERAVVDDEGKDEQ